MNKPLLLIGLIALFGCEKELNQTLPYPGDQLVLFGKLSASKSIGVLISKTYNPTGPFDYSDRPMGLTALVYQNGHVFDTLSYAGDDLYSSKQNRLPKPGEHYSVKVWGGGFDTLETAKIVLQKPIQKAELKFLQETRASLNPSEEAWEFEVSLTDDSSRNDYYFLDILAYAKGRRFNAIKSPVGKNTDIQDPCGFFTANLAFAFTDECMLSNEQKITYNIEKKLFDSDSFEPRKIDSLVFQIEKIDKTLYLFMKNNIELNLLENAFYGHPLTKSNIVNGWGIWAAVESVRFVHVVDSTSNEQEILYGL